MAALVIADGHRSVWLACAVAVAVLVVLGEVRLSRVWRWGFVTATAAAVVVAILAARGMDVVAYVATRAHAFISPSTDTTSAWRLSIWSQVLASSRSHLIAGEGYGSYFKFQTGSLGETTISVTPHNLYLEMLANLGVVGLGLLVALTLATFPGLWAGWKTSASRRSPWMRIVVCMGLVALFVMLAYGIVYTLAIYPLVFYGLGIAAALIVHREAQELGAVSSDAAAVQAAPLPPLDGADGRDRLVT